MLCEKCDGLPNVNLLATRGPHSTRNISIAMVDRQADVDTLLSGLSERSCREWLRNDTVTASEINYLKDSVLWEIIPMIRFFIDGS